MRRFSRFLPRSRARAINNLKGLSGIIYVKRHGTPVFYGSIKTLYDKFIRWSRMGIFAKTLCMLAQPGVQGDTLMMDSTFLKMDRTAASPRQKRIVRGHRTPERRPVVQVAQAR